jgi:hypothetical protein
MGRACVVGGCPSGMVEAGVVIDQGDLARASNDVGSEGAQRPFEAGDHEAEELAIVFAVFREPGRRFFGDLHQVLHRLSEDRKRLLGPALVGPEGVLREHRIVPSAERP